MKNLLILIAGFLFGTILLKSEAISWYRIQEMFLFESFHMYGVLLSAIGTAAIGVFLIKKLKIKNIEGKEISFSKKPINWKNNIIGGLFFGIGWGITGACTAPIYVLIGTQLQTSILLLLGALIGAYVFGLIKK